MMAIAGEANQIFRPVSMFDYSIDGEVEFKDNDGRTCGKKIYIQLKSGNSYLRSRTSDGREVFDVKNEWHLKCRTSRPVDVYLVIRQTDEAGGGQVIRSMNVTPYLKARRTGERPARASRGGTKGLRGGRPASSAREWRGSSFRRACGRQNKPGGGNRDGRIP